VNANPSGSRTPPTGGWGRSIARRESASTTEPRPNRLQTICRAGGAGPVNRRAVGSASGTRHAMTACRQAPNPRRSAQGRNGEGYRPRHVNHLVSQPLPLANLSASAGMVRRLISDRGRHLFRDERALAGNASRPKAQPRDRDAPSPHRGARDTELAQPVHGVALTPVDGPPRGKGVLAA
jgi:hypothetical protein